MNNYFLSKSTVNLMLLIALACTESTLKAWHTPYQPLHEAYGEDDSFYEGEEYANEEEYIFVNHIEGSLEPVLDVVRIMLEFIGSNGDQKIIFIEPTFTGDPNTYEDTLLNNHDETLSQVRISKIINQNGTVTTNALGFYDPAYFQEPGIFEFYLDDNGNVILEKDNHVVPLMQQ